MRRRMIGKGWQFRVYDLGNERVQKVPRSSFDSYFRALFSPLSPTRFRPFESVREVENTAFVRARAIENFKKVKDVVPREWFGNPTFNGGEIYGQDLLPTFEEYFATHTPGENKNLIRKYVWRLTEFWQYGFSDDVFNFAKNNGVTKSGEVVLLDLGELTFSREQVAQSIREEKWLQGPVSYNLIPHRGVAEVFKREMEQYFTLEILNEVWGTLLT